MVIPFNRASLGAREAQGVTRVLASARVAGAGSVGRALETEISQYLGSGRSLLTTSCTHALELAASLLGASPGDEVIVPSFTFVSTASAFMTRGMRPVFADVQPDTFCIDPHSVEQLISKKTKAICAVHYGGIAADVDALSLISESASAWLIEDNAHGLFGTMHGRNLGTFGDISTMSFHETKNITCGEGGAIHIEDMDLVERAEILRDKGTDRQKFFRGQVDKYVWREVGSSWVLSEVLSAILRAQWTRREEIQAKRLAIWNRYHQELCEWSEKWGVQQPTVPDGCLHPAHLYFLVMRSPEHRSRLIQHLEMRGVMAVFHYQALHLSPVGVRLGGRAGQCPVSEAASDRLVRLPLFADLSPSEVDQIVVAVTEFRP